MVQTRMNAVTGIPRRKAGSDGGFQHGTAHGYNIELERGLDPCGPCKEAWAMRRRGERAHF